MVVEKPETEFRFLPQDELADTTRPAPLCMHVHKVFGDMRPDLQQA
jgi:hypothetical protein